MKANTKHFIRAAALVVSMGFFTMLPNYAKSQTDKIDSKKNTSMSQNDTSANFAQFATKAVKIIEKFKNDSDKKLAHMIADKKTMNDQTNNLKDFSDALPKYYFEQYNQICDLAITYQVTAMELAKFLEIMSNNYREILHIADSAMYGPQIKQSQIIR